MLVELDNKESSSIIFLILQEMIRTYKKNDCNKDNEFDDFNSEYISSLSRLAEKFKDDSVGTK